MTAPQQDCPNFPYLHKELVSTKKPGILLSPLALTAQTLGWNEALKASAVVTSIHLMETSEHLLQAQEGSNLTNPFPMVPRVSGRKNDSQKCILLGSDREEPNCSIPAWNHTSSSSTSFYVNYKTTNAMSSSY